MNYFEKQYTGTYKVYRVYRVSGRIQILQRGLTRKQAMKIVNSFPDNNNSIVVFDKQFKADKYYN